MKPKYITLVSIILLSISLIIVFTLGNTYTITLDKINIKDITVNCDNKIISCDLKQNKEDVNIIVKSISTGKSDVNIKSNKEIKYYGGKERNITMYVHNTGIITASAYLGRCNGDVSFIITFYIIIFMILFTLIRKLRYGIKNNLYSYKNASTMGLIIFIVVPLLFNFYYFVVDLFYGYNQTINMFFGDIRESSFMFLLLILPIAFILNILVTISNINLVLKEGGSFRNILGILFSFFINISVFILICINALVPFNIYLKAICDILSAYIVYFECIFFGASIIGIISAKHIPKFDKDGIIILGCQINEDGTLPKLLRSRVDRAIEFSKMQKENTNKDIIFIPSGGQGKDEIMSEAKAMKNYLIEQGIDKDNILIEDKSTSTYENIKYSYEIISKKIKNPKLAFSTTNYHTFRAGIIARKQGIDIEGIGSKTKSYFFINAFIREYIATIVSERNRHFKALVLLTIVMILLTIIIIL